MPKMMPEIFSSPVITRYQEGRPILTKENVPYPAELIFNAGVTKYQGKYVMVFRDDYDCHNGFPKKTHLALSAQMACIGKFRLVPCGMQKCSEPLKSRGFMIPV